MMMKPPPPNKQPPPPPPPPPRPKTQTLGASNHSVNSNISGILSSKTNGSNGLPNIGSSINSLNSVGGRFSHTQPHGNGSFAISSNGSQRCFPRHGDTFNSRSSLTSHKSLQHYHHAPGYGCDNVAKSTCQAPHCLHHSCACSKTQHNHANSSSMSDNGSFSQENRHYLHSQFGGNCECNSSSNSCHSHLHNSAATCQAQNASSQAMKSRIGGLADGHMPTMAANMIPFCTGDNSDADQISNGCLSDSGLRGHCAGSFSHHLEHEHHHHHHHHTSMTSSSPASQHVDQNGSQFSGCTSQSINTNTASLDQGSRTISNCSHAHRSNICGHHHHHHQANCCDHHVPLAVPEKSCGCENCAHSDNGHLLHHSCGSNLKSCAASSSSHHYTPELIANQTSGATLIDPTISTVHTHNLSNSSTTTHTSNVAVRHQPQFYNPISFRGCGDRSDSSQHYEHYGLSSGASTSSANASLSCYQTNGGYEVVPPCPAPSKMNQPLPPPPPPPLSAIKSRQQPPTFFGDRKMDTMSSSQQTSLSDSRSSANLPNKGLPNPPSNHNGGSHGQPSNCQQQQHTGPLLNLKPTPPISTIGKQPNLSYQSTQTSERFDNQSAPELMVQGQLAKNQPPPFAPPIPPTTSRPQLSAIRNSPRNQHVDSTQQDTNPIPGFINLNLRNRNGAMTTAEAKLEELTREVELNLEKQQKSGEPHGICPKCGNKVMPTQEACKAMNQIYHASCFICCECSRTLSDKTFYPVGDKVYCEEDFKYTGHLKSLEKCAACSQPIFDMILPAMGKSYHPKCFKCSVCSQCLDGVPFTIDRENKIYCVKDYHSIYSPKCAACGKAISPVDGTGETVRVVSMDKDYHIECYC